MKRIISTFIFILVATSLAVPVFAQGTTNSVSGFGAPASADGSSSGAGIYTSTPAGNAPASAGSAPASAGSYSSSPSVSPASAGGAPTGAGTYTPTPAGNAPASAGGAPDIGSVNPPVSGAN
jgi:putative serine protease PepD